jgi:hypothetical protein
MAVYNAEALRRRHHRMDRRAEQKWRVLTKMRDGDVLNRYHASGRIIWSLSRHGSISHEAAADVIADPMLCQSVTPWAHGGRLKLIDG